MRTILRTNSVTKHGREGDARHCVRYREERDKRDKHIRASRFRKKRHRRKSEIAETIQCDGDEQNRKRLVFALNQAAARDGEKNCSESRKSGKRTNMHIASAKTDSKNGKECLSNTKQKAEPSNVSVQVPRVLGINRLTRFQRVNNACPNPLVK
jgi:hypothetical protein